MTKREEGLLRNCASWGVTARALARSAGIQRDTALRHLRRLEQRGLVSRRRHRETDGRTVTVWSATGDGVYALQRKRQETT